jgi:hypothetical protein
MATPDIGFLLAVATFGWGLSLATYRLFALQLGWPLGKWHLERPRVPIFMGAFCIALAMLFALARGYGGHVLSAWAILVFGVAWALFWTGFLRVGAQNALVLGPAAALLLLMRWLG